MNNDYNIDPIYSDMLGNIHHVSSLDDYTSKSHSIFDDSDYSTIHFETPVYSPNVQKSINIIAWFLIALVGFVALLAFALYLGWVQ